MADPCISKDTVKMFQRSGVCVFVSQVMYYVGDMEEDTEYKHFCKCDMKNVTQIVCFELLLISDLKCKMHKFMARGFRTTVHGRAHLWRHVSVTD